MTEIRGVLAALVVVAIVWVSAIAGATAADRDTTMQVQTELIQTTEKAGLLKPEAVGSLTKALEAEAELFPGPTHAQLWLLNALCRAHKANMDYSAAERASAAAVAIQTQFFGPRSNGDVAKGRDATEAIRRFQRAVEVRKIALGERHLLVGFTQVDLALAYETDGQTDQSRKVLEQIVLPRSGGLVSAAASDAKYQLDRILLSIPSGAAATTVTDEPQSKLLDRAERLVADADRLIAEGKLEEARAVWKTLFPSSTSYHADAVPETTQLEFARRRRLLVERFVGFAARSGLADSAAAGAYRDVVYHKGGVFTAQYRYRIERHHPILKPVFDAHEDLTRHLAYRAQSAPAGDREVRLLLARKAALEAEMARRYEVMPKQLHAPPAQYLPAGTVLVDYYTYRTVSPDGKAERGLACFVSRPEKTHRGKEVVFRDLGRLEPVATAVAQWREDILARGGAESEAAAEVRKRVWEPLLPLLDGATVALVCPDASLSAVPFAALPGAKRGTYLIEEIGVALAPTPQLIQRLPSLTDSLAKRGDLRGIVRPRSERTDSPLLVGGVAFGKRPALPRSGLDTVFKLLPGTAKEVVAIDTLFRDVLPGKKLVVLTGSDATETAVRKAAGAHRWVHIATHGYFAPASKEGSNLPELRSGVVLAGVNAGGTSSDDDGILTALEVASLDLSHVDLAVLSACETGLGRVQEGEGVFGLQRAFQMAGARTTITSLWPVDDDATSALMERFYLNLWAKKMTIAEALRESQLWMLREGKKHDGVARGLRKVGVPQPADDGRMPPYYWAAFVLAGDCWR